MNIAVPALTLLEDFAANARRSGLEILVKMVCIWCMRTKLVSIML